MDYYIEVSKGDTRSLDRCLSEVCTKDCLYGRGVRRPDSTSLRKALEAILTTILAVGNFGIWGIRFLSC